MSSKEIAAANEGHRSIITLKLEQGYWKKGVTRIAGVDEAGRGPLAGPVVAAAVIFEPHFWIEGIDDSKKLCAAERERLFKLIQRYAISIGIGIVDNDVIDRVNILNATFRSMHEAVIKLKHKPEHLLIDGPFYPGENIPFTTVVRGDSTSFTIAAASIVAKVTRDHLMGELDKRFPNYGFAKHKGYGTIQHMEAIRKYGPCKIHRRSFHIPLKNDR